MDQMEKFMDDLQLIWTAFIGLKEMLICHKEVMDSKLSQKQNLVMIPLNSILN